MARARPKHNTPDAALVIYTELTSDRFDSSDRLLIASNLQGASGQVLAALNRVPGDLVGLAIAGQAWAGVSAMRGAAARLRSASEPEHVGLAKERLATEIDRIAVKMAATLEVPIAWLAWVVRPDGPVSDGDKWLTCQNTGSMAAVLICQCCGQYSVELIYLDVARGGRPRLRVRHGQYYLGDYANPFEVAEMLRKRGVLDQLVEASDGSASPK